MVYIKDGSKNASILIYWKNAANLWLQKVNSARRIVCIKSDFIGKFLIHFRSSCALSMRQLRHPSLMIKINLRMSLVGRNFRF
jgi:hypothetical protein